MILKSIELAFVVSGVLFVVSYLTVLYVWYVKLEEIESHLKKNTIATNNRKNWAHAGYIGRMMRFSMILVSFLFASTWSRRKLLNIDEVRMFPKGLKRWLYIPFISSVSLMVLMVAILVYMDNR